MLTPDQTRAFYNSWEEPDLYASWSGLWRKHIKIVTNEGIFIALNKKTPRLNHRKLRKYAVKIAHIHIYAGVMEYLRPEKVLSKDRTLKAYPVRGEFVIDVDAYMNYQKHRHRTEPEGFCCDCLEQAKELILKLLDLVKINYEDILIIFSGKHGFHIHVRDFEVRDWTYYDSGNPLKSHEVARRIYVELLKQHVPQAFDIPHYILSCDVTRVMTLPETVNGETGLICSSYNPDQFRDKSIKEIIAQAKGAKHITAGLNWETATEWRNPRVLKHRINRH